MAVRTTSIEGLLVSDWPQHDDARGSFRQTHQTAELATALGREVVFRQGNHARSHPGVVRGFHAEPWDKFVYVAHGNVMAAIADIRPHSETFGAVEVFHLGDPPGDGVGLFVSDGLANGYCAYGTAPADYLYLVSETWRTVDNRAIAYDDPDLGVAWPVTDPILSDADRGNPTLRERFPTHPRFSPGSDPVGKDPSSTAPGETS